MGPRHRLRQEQDGRLHDQVHELHTVERETGFSPENFYDGTYWSSQVDCCRHAVEEFDIGLANPMTFATGANTAVDRYGIKPAS